ncbi:MAG: hypothetical protein ACK4F9_04550 [Brevinematia bacterium]
MVFVRLLRILVFIVFLCIIFYSYAQKSSYDSKKDKMVVSGDEGFFKKGYTRFKGNAYVEKGTVKMFADVIEYFETNNLALGKGNVRLFDSSSGLNVVSGYSEYYGNSNIVLFFNSPLLTVSNKKMLLKGEVIVLDQDSESVLSITNSYLSNDGIEMLSHSIKIFSSSNLIVLSGSSKIFSTNFVIYSDRAFIHSGTNKNTKEVEIKRYVGIGGVVIVGSNFSLSSKKIVINFSNGQLFDYVAFGDVKISNNNAIVFADYFKSQFLGGDDVLHVGMTNVVVSNLSSGDVLYSDYLISDKLNKYELIAGDDVIYYINNGSVKVKSKVVERFLDRGIAILKKDVVVQSGNISIVGDIGKYDEGTKILYMLGNPKVVSEDKLGVSANVITIDVEKNKAQIENGLYGYVMQ